MCPNGTFNNLTGLAAENQCQLCTPGEYCIPEGLVLPYGPCPNGYYCPLGTADPMTYPCPIGFFRNSASREKFDDCTICTSGFYCDELGLGEPKSCPHGFFCVEGSTYPEPCPLGTYGNSTEVRQSSDCTPCPGGYYCDGLGRVEPTGPCDAGFYCREKAYTSAPPEGLTGGICPPGGYCPVQTAVPQPCPQGYYSASEGADSPEDCIPCPPGTHCCGN